MAYFVCIVTTRKGGPLYIDVAADLADRDALARAAGQSFSESLADSAAGTGWAVPLRLVYYEECGGLLAAIQRERVIRRWPRASKLMRIEARNPDWRDLAPDPAGAPV